MIKKLSFIAAAILALLTGLLFPSVYLFVDAEHTFLGTKLPEVASNMLWKFSFALHIGLGGISLVIGWVPFIEKLRNRNLKLHRNIGKVYIISVIISSISSIYMGFFANGGFISASGFICLGIFWLITTTSAFISIKKGNAKKHQILMTYSYACTFAAVTLRLWIPLLNSLSLNPNSAYLVTAWLCWVPNVIVAFLINRKRSILDHI